jgi:hypothetical protein
MIFVIRLTKANIGCASPVTITSRSAPRARPRVSDRRPVETVELLRRPKLPPTQRMRHADARHEGAGRGTIARRQFGWRATQIGVVEHPICARAQTVADDARANARATKCIVRWRARRSRPT